MQSLGRGLAVLSYIVSATGPVTATQVASHVGMHQTTASRILADLVRAGYVRRVAYREFAPDFGLLLLGLESTRHFDMLARSRPAMERAAAMCSGLTVSLCLWWHDRLLYVSQASRGMDTQIFRGGDYPLHLSSPGLLFMLDRPPVQAVAALKESARKFGWDQPTAEVAATPEGVLQAARRHRRQDTLVLAGWAGPAHLSAAIRLADHEGVPLALTISGASDVMTAETIRLRLKEIRRVVEPAIRAR